MGTLTPHACVCAVCLDCGSSELLPTLWCIVLRRWVASHACGQCCVLCTGAATPADGDGPPTPAALRYAAILGTINGDAGITTVAMPSAWHDRLVNEHTITIHQGAIRGDCAQVTQRQLQRARRALCAQLSHPQRPISIRMPPRRRTAVGSTVPAHPHVLWLLHSRCVHPRVDGRACTAATLA